MPLANPLEHLAPSPPAEIMNAVEFVQAAPPEARFLFHAHPASGSNFFVTELKELGIGDILHEVSAWPSRVVAPKIIVTWEDVRPPEGVKSSWGGGSVLVRLIRRPILAQVALNVGTDPFQILKQYGC